MFATVHSASQSAQRTVGTTTRAPLLRPLLLSLSLGLVTLQPLAAQGTGRIELQVQGVRNSTGNLGCALYASEAGFPRDSAKAHALMTSPINAGTGRCVFTGVPPGTYAALVMHDENLNQKLDTNLFGAPTEGYGVSNNKTSALSAPKWEETRFDLAEGQTRSLTVQLRY